MSARAWAVFAAMSVIWGTPYLLIKVALEGGAPPLLVVWGRVLIAAVVLLILAARAGTLPALREHARWVLAFAAIEIAGPFTLITYGEQRIPSSLAAILIATVPLIIAVIALAFDTSERLSGSRTLGLLIGFAGVLALVGIDASRHPHELLGVVALLLAAVGYALGPLVLRHGLAGLDPRASMGSSLAVAALLIAPAALAGLPGKAPGAGSVLAIVGLGLVCTALAFVLYTVLIEEAGASRASVITYVNPVVAVALGVALLGERLGAGSVAGLLLIVAGSWLSTGGVRPRAQRRRTSAEMH